MSPVPSPEITHAPVHEGQIRSSAGGEVVVKLSNKWKVRKESMREVRQERWKFASSELTVGHDAVLLNKWRHLAMQVVHYTLQQLLKKNTAKKTCK